MRRYNLNIAGYNIGIRGTENGPDLVPGARFIRNICEDTDMDLLISVHSGPFIIPSDAVRVFHAPFVEEAGGIQIHHKANFWSIWKFGYDLFIMTIFPLSTSEKNAVLKFSLTSSEWDLWVEGDESEIDPFEYPLDGLILYYLTVINGDIMIHSSGVNNLGQGYLFSGVSGKGKTTMANLWKDAGAKVIHDDRLIIRYTCSGYRMYNTPVYEHDEPLSSPLNKVFIIEHGTENILVPLKEATAVSHVMANCIQHNWGQDIIGKLLGSVSTLCNTLPVFKLSFKPDRSVIDHIQEYE
jgi:hypothetical protein